MRKIILAASAALVAFSGAAMASEARPAPHHAMTSIDQPATEHSGAYGFAGLEPASDAHHYHGGPKAND
jgi:opacity protein-like surface antigen